MQTHKYIVTVLFPFAAAFTKPTFARIVELFVGAILCRGRKTIARIIAVFGGQQTGHMTDYHRVLSRAPWKTYRLFVILAGLVLAVVSQRPAHLQQFASAAPQPGAGGVRAFRGTLPILRPQPAPPRRGRTPRNAKQRLTECRMQNLPQTSSLKPPAFRKSLNPCASC